MRNKRPARASNDRAKPVEPENLVNFRRFTALATFAAVLWASILSPASAQDTAAAQSFLEGKQEQVRSLLRRPANARRTAQLTSLLANLLDYEELSRRALGEHWEARSEAERTDFVAVLRQLVERNYQANLQNTLEFDVRYLGADAADGAVVVRTEARSQTNRRAPAVSIDYTLRHNDGEWRVFDVKTDGSSMVRAYRSQFNRIISRDGWDGLMTRMRGQLANTGE